ncbi:C2 family cysteine protease [Antribacter gilvus]|uniref:C2 family cysteine protease n=1 Tax=Antribacter gilvus TaxID=2304675 RepID=UPI000F790EBA|nr:C2 family cysteine protease [Antribacter gilvus]
MSEFWGADVQQLRELGRRLGSWGEDLQGVPRSVDPAVASAPWKGPNREAFVAEWRGQHRPAIAAAGAALADMATRLAANAEAQERKSNGGGGSGGGGGAGGAGGDGAPRSTEGNPTDNGEHKPIGPVDLDEDEFRPDNISQGQMGDCSLLASAAAMAKADPEWLQEHMKYDADTNTYTVTLYDEDGNPVEVKVEGSLIDPAAMGADGNPAWVSVYEKAAAQFQGGYENIQSQWPQDMMKMMTGKDADEYSTDAFLPWNERSTGEIRDDLADGKPVVAWTPKDVDHDDIVGGHAYMVDSVDKDGNVRLMNPWGPNAGEPHYVTLTEEEFKKNFSNVAVSEKPGD